MNKVTRWLKLNDTYAAVNENGQLVGYMPDIRKPLIRPPEGRQGHVAVMSLPKR